MSKRSAALSILGTNSNTILAGPRYLRIACLGLDHEDEDRIAFVTNVGQELEVVEFVQQSLGPPIEYLQWMPGP